MKSLDPNPESCRRNGVIGLGLMRITVWHGVTRYEVFVPSSSSFGYLKSFICQKIGLRPESHKLFFRGTEKEDDEGLQAAGLTDNPELLLMEVKACEQESHEEVHETSVISKGAKAVSEVRKEVDKLAQQVSALQALVDRGIIVDDKEIVYLIEMLMRQLLKLDGIEAEGEGKVQRKMEVRRIQSMVETLDVLKSKNSNAFSETRKSLSVTTQWEACNPVCENVNASFTMSGYASSSAVPSSVSFKMPSSKI